MSKFEKTEYGNNKTILAFKDHYVPMSAVMDADGVTTNENGKKIVPAGTFVGGASASIFVDRSEKLKVVHDHAALETSMVGDNNDIKLTALEDGAGGAGISLTLIDPSANSADLDVTVTGKDISVSLATNGGGTITTTASELIAAINADADAKKLVTAALKGEDTGAGAVTALAKTNLANSAISGASVIDGILLEDVDVTYGDANAPLLIHGWVKADKLPVAPTSVMRVAFSKNIFLGFIEH